MTWRMHLPKQSAMKENGCMDLYSEFLITARSFYLCNEFKEGNWHTQFLRQDGLGLRVKDDDPNGFK